jgi:hypothetical protein
MMVTLRSAVLCDSVDLSPEGLTAYHGVRGDAIQVDSRPGLVHVTLALQLEVDDAPGPGEIRLRFGTFDHRFEFDVSAGQRHVHIQFPLLLPVLEAGDLDLFVQGDGRNAAPGRATWRVGFAPDARVLAPDAAADAARIGELAAAMIAADLASRRKPH